MIPVSFNSASVTDHSHALCLLHQFDCGVSEEGKERGFPSTGSRLKSIVRFNTALTGPGWWAETPRTAFSTTIAAMFTLIAFALCVWIILRILSKHSSWTAGSMIGSGGSFTQLQAKLLDLLSSSIITPLIMAIFNYCCFKTARTWAINEQTGRKHTISLQALVEVSTTDRGSYGPMKLFALLQTRSVGNRFISNRLPCPTL